MIELPNEFIDRLQHQFDGTDRIIEAMNSSPPTSLRVNSTKNYTLKNQEKVPWADNGYYLLERPIFTLDPYFHAGCYYPQEAGSMFLETVLKHIKLPSSPVVFDMCAAPGGKSLILADFLQGNGTLISNDISKSRANILAENTAKWGFSNGIVTSNNPASFLNASVLFDVILIDAPCSGEGMFRKDHEARKHWSLNNCEISQKRQFECLEIANELLKEHGYLIYSTCTFNPAENEKQLKAFISNYGYSIIELNIMDEIQRDSLDIGVQFIPGLTKSEGFYCALLQKNNGGEERRAKQKKDKSFGFKVYDQYAEIKTSSNKEIVFTEHDNHVLATNYQTIEIQQKLKQHLFLLKYGTSVYEKIKDKLKPSVEMAFAQDVRWNGPSIELNESNALEYLRGNTFEIEAGKDFYQINYVGNGLGYINHTGIRFNNLFPKNWRIKMRS